MSTPVIQTFGLSKSYKRGKVALSGLDLTVNQGEIFGYLGPNGAGKTTTIRLLLDLIRPDKGRASVLGLDVNKDSIAIRKRIGFLPGEMNLWEGQTGKRVIGYMGDLRGGVDPKFVASLIERLDFDPSKTVRSYSSGNRRKLGLILAVMHRPEVLILDEPTNGLDPLMQQVFHQLMLEERARGATVFLSSHILSEVQAICERVAILREGTLRKVERVDELVRVNFQWLTLEFRQPVPVSRLQGVPGVADVSADGNRIKLRLTGDADPVLRALEGEYIVNLRTQEPSLEEIFLTYYSDATNGHRANGSNNGTARTAARTAEKENVR